MTRSTSWLATKASLMQVAKKGGAGGADGSRASAGGARSTREKPPIFGMIQRGGDVVIRMLANVQQVTIKPLIQATIAPGSVRLHG